MLKRMDAPPVWLAGFAGLAWLQARFYPMSLSSRAAWPQVLGIVMICGGVIVIALAVFEMYRRRTPVMPRREAAELVTSGIFRRSRNPIYLGLTLILTGWVLGWEAALTLPLVPIFMWVLEERFIMPEENALRRKFGADFARYMQRTRRWV